MRATPASTAVKTWTKKRHSLYKSTNYFNMEKTYYSVALFSSYCEVATTSASSGHFCDTRGDFFQSRTVLHQLKIAANAIQTLGICMSSRCYSKALEPRLADLTASQVTVPYLEMTRAECSSTQFIETRWLQRHCATLRGR